MKEKIPLLIILLILIFVSSLSGCTESIDTATTGTGECCVAGVIGLVVFIILIAYLLGGKKTVVHTTQTSPTPPVIIREETMPSERKSDRYCPSCGRAIPFDAKACPYCGKDFEEDSFEVVD